MFKFTRFSSVIQICWLHIVGNGDLTLLLTSKEPNIEELINNHQPQYHINKSIIVISIIIYFYLFLGSNYVKNIVLPYMLIGAI